MVAVRPNHLVLLLPRPEIPPILSAYPCVPLYLAPNITCVLSCCAKTRCAVLASALAVTSCTSSPTQHHDIGLPFILPMLLSLCDVYDVNFGRGSRIAVSPLFSLCRSIGPETFKEQSILREAEAHQNTPPDPFLDSLH